MARKVCPPLAGAIDLAVTLPWQIGGGLALLMFWGLHDLGVGATIGKGADVALIDFFLYLVPGLLLIVALISFVRGSQHDELSIQAVSSPSADALARISPDDLEKLVAEGFRREGYLVVERAGAQHQGCVDLELFMGRDRYLVQCRRWQEPAVDARAVRELYVAISTERAVGGFIVASGKFTDEARKMAMGRSIRIVPADSLGRLMKTVGTSCSGEVATPPVFSRRSDDPAPPACPRCGKVMMARTTRQDGTVVQLDWCCTSFPACQGSRGV